MPTLTISMPDQLRAYVDDRVNSGDFGNVSEYFRDLIRRDRDERLPSEAVVEAEVLKSLKSGPAAPLTADDWATARDVVQRAIAKRTTTKSARKSPPRSRRHEK